MPVDHPAPAPAARPLRHIRKLAFAAGALFALLALYVLRLAIAL